MFQDIFIIGATGKVGKTLVGQIYQKRDVDGRVHKNPTRIIGLASSKNYILDPSGLDEQAAFSFLKKPGNHTPYPNLDALLRIVVEQLGNKQPAVFVDATALKSQMQRFHRAVIEDTPHGIVTANKNPIAFCTYTTFLKLTQQPHRYGYRCSVMAGAGAVPLLLDLRDLSDQPRLIQGCFSGTLGFICSELEKGKSFSAILREAMRKGYTEPDPRDDLNGMDVARKLIVLARSAGFDVEMADIKVNPFIPSNFIKKEGASSFLKATAQSLDPYFRKKFRQARSKGNTFRYVAELDALTRKPRLRVSLKAVPMDSPLGKLKGTLNKIVVISETFPEYSPYSIEAPGAGLAVTAQNIRRDLLYLLRSRKISR